MSLFVYLLFRDNISCQNSYRLSFACCPCYCLGYCCKTFVIYHPRAKTSSIPSTYQKRNHMYLSLMWFCTRNHVAHIPQPSMRGPRPAKCRFFNRGGLSAQRSNIEKPYRQNNCINVTFFQGHTSQERDLEVSP